MVFLAVLVVGFLSYPQVPIQLLPDGISMGEVSLFVPAPDGTPQENMEQIAKPCEDFLRTLPGLRNIVSSSGARRVRISLEFDPRYDIGLMVAEIRDRVERARSSWPEGVDRYFVWRYGGNEMPMYIASLGLDIAERHKESFAQRGLEDHIYDEIISKRLESVRGVARVRIWGMLSQRVEIALDKGLLLGHGVDLSSLLDRLRMDNRSVSAGVIREGERELPVRVDSRFDEFAEIEEYPADEKFRIRDFASVRRRRAVRDQLSRVNGKHSRAIVVYKESGANAADVCRRVEAEIAAVGEDLRRTVAGIEGVEYHNWLNQGEVIGASIDGLRLNALVGGGFAVVVLFLFFRRVGMTLLVTLAIPFSLLITVIWVYFRGGSFNLLSMMGLSLSIGMLVDNSIVVVESILRKTESGENRVSASILAVREVGLAVSMATLTTVMVFLPLVFLADPRFKVVTSEIALPLCVSVLASLVVALVFIPQGAIHVEKLGHRFASARLLGALTSSMGRRPGERSGSGHVARDSLLNRATVGAVRWALGHRGFAFLAGLALPLTLSYAFETVSKEAMDMDGPSRLLLTVDLPSNFTLREADEHFTIIEDAIRKAGVDFEIKSINSRFDSRGGEINVFSEPGERVDEDDFFATVRPALPELPGVSYRLGFEDFEGGSGGQRLMVFVQGNDFDLLQQSATRIEAALRDRDRFPCLREVHRWREDELEEVRVSVDRRSATHQGIDTARVSRMVAWALRGSQLTDYVEPDREYPFWVRYADADKENVEELNDILVFGEGGSPIPLANLAGLSVVPGSGDIHRRRGKMSIGVSARVEGSSLYEARKSVDHHLSRLDLPRGCHVSMQRPGGSFEEDMGSAVIALSMALCLVFFVMGLLFESWILPLSVIGSIPFAFVGSLWLLVATGTSLDAVGMIGMLMLVGIVVNNAIVLVDSINRRRAGGAARKAAILEAVRLRFRPIWMTALTTIFGLLPLMVLPQTGEGVDYKSLATVLVGGLATSTFFTLFVVPLLYDTFDDVRRVARSLVRGAFTGKRP